MCGWHERKWISWNFIMRTFYLYLFLFHSLLLFAQICYIWIRKNSNIYDYDAYNKIRCALKFNFTTEMDPISIRFKSRACSGAKKIVLYFSIHSLAREIVIFCLINVNYLPVYDICFCICLHLTNSLYIVHTINLYVIQKVGTR